jgi:predicted ATP-dependent endonuclease of OLD family
MLDSITIKNFKAITELTLSGLSNVNYLVGKNGCGKSSVLEAISYYDKEIRELVNQKYDNRNYKNGFEIEYKCKDLIFGENPEINFTCLINFNDNDYEERKSIENILNKVNVYIDEWVCARYEGEKIGDYIVTTANLGSKDFNQNTIKLPNLYNGISKYHQNQTMESWRVSTFEHYSDELAKLNNVYAEQIKENMTFFNCSMDRFFKNGLSDINKEEINLNCINYNLSSKEEIELRNLNKSERITLLEILVNIGTFSPPDLNLIYADNKVLIFGDTENTSILLSSLSDGQKLIIRLFYQLEEVKFQKKYHLVLIDEPEIGLHPEVQIFVSTHSNYLISEAVKLPEQKVYHFDDVGVVKNPDGISSIEINSFNNVMDSLGAKPSDMLFVNGIIWVEGPADIIYIQKWLEMYCSENDKMLFEKGVHYEFAMYGGALLSYLYGGDTTKKQGLQNIFRVNTRAFVICDSDKKDEFSKDVSTYTEAKKEIKAAVGIENFWCDELVKTIENYVIKENEDTWKYHRNCSFNITEEKPKKAFLRIEHWKEKNIKLNNFATTLLPNIKKLYEVIESWNK